MKRILTFAGLAAAAAGGYALGRRGDLHLTVGKGLQADEATQTTEISLSVTRRPGYDTEFHHVAAHEHAERHRVAEEIKGHPLGQRSSRTRRHAPDVDELTPVASQPLTHDRDDLIAPRPY